MSPGKVSVGEEGEGHSIDGPKTEKAREPTVERVWCQESPD